MWQFLQKILKKAFSGNMIISWMMLAAIVPMLLIVYFSYNLAKITLYQTINRDITIAMRKKAARIDNYVSERKLDLLQLTKLPDFLEVKSHASSTVAHMQQANLSQTKDAKLEDLITYLKYIGPKVGFTNVYLMNIDGKIEFILHPDEHEVGAVVTDKSAKYEALYHAFIGAKIVQIPFIYSEYKNKEAEIYVSGVVTDEGRMQAVLVANLDISAIQRVVDQFVGYTASEETILAAMMDHKPTIIMQSSLRGASSYNSPLIMQFLKYAIRGGIKYPYWDQSGKGSYLIAAQYIPQLNIGLLLRYNETEIHHKVNWFKFKMLLLIGISLFIVLTIVFWVSNALRNVTRKNEDLLGSILPKFVIEELNEKGRFAARNIKQVSIVFMDIVNFTGFAAASPPEKVVGSLDNLFSIFDSLCDRYQVEKIKTIGDAHMSASGLITFQEDHADRAVNMALEAIRAVKHYNLDHDTDFSLRIGIDSGMITAGIIGQRKPGYDIWGHVVNRASRMESTGVVNQVQITEATFNALKHPEAFQITKRKNVSVKGLGAMDTYLVDTLHGEHHE